jgi:hypothetical protein
MQEDRSLPSFRYLLILIAVGLLAGIVQPLVQGVYLTSRVLVTLVAVFALVLLAYRWPNIKSDALRLSGEKLANDFRTWLVITFLVWGSNVVINALSEIRRNNEVIALRNDIQSMARVIERGVLPRHLTRSQSSSLISFIQEHGTDSPVQMALLVKRDNSEADGYRADIEGALIKAGWSLRSINGVDYSDSVPEGLSIYLVQGNSHPPRNSSPSGPQLLLLEALGLAGVRVDGSIGGGGGGERAEGKDQTDDLVTIAIGARKMDSDTLTLPRVAP